MRYVVIVIGISGAERFLARPGETKDERQADRFATEKAGIEAGTAYMRAFPPPIARMMGLRVETASSRRSSTAPPSKRSAAAASNGASRAGSAARRYD